MVVRGVRVSIKRLHSLRSIVMALVCSVILSVLGACSTESPPTTPSRRPNFILIVVDALRADRLHYAGHRKDMFSNLDELRDQSTSLVEIHDDHFAPDARDEGWLAVARKHHSHALKRRRTHPGSPPTSSGQGTSAHDVS